MESGKRTAWRGLGAVASPLAGAAVLLGIAALVLPGCGPSSPAKRAQAAVCHYAHDGQAVLPDRRCTPGATDPRVTPATVAKTICVAGYTKRVRPPTSYTDPLKRRLMAQYGVAGPASAYELDHLVPLEVGGAPTDPLNLWPEPLAGAGGARAKDQVENAIRREVCAHPLRLATAQARIAADWTDVEPLVGQ